MRREDFSKEALKFLDALHHFAIRLTANPDSAADLVQETYLKAIDKQHQFQAGTNMKAWLFTILKNLHINRAVRARREEPLETGPGGHSPANVIRHQFLKPEEQSRWITREDLERALAQIPEIFRVTLLLSDYEGFSYREIAGILDIPQGTVMSRISRGRQALRSQLAVYAGEGAAES